MYNILIIGAGKSSGFLLKYLSNHARSHNGKVTVTDKSQEQLEISTQGLDNIQTIQADVMDENQRAALMKDAGLVISFLPPAAHVAIARDCLQHNANLITPSYASSEMTALKEEFTQKGLTCINETGLDPGIDHASAARDIEKLHREGSRITCFESYTGGLVTPESADNPWKYKATWHPGGIIHAGRGVNRYLHQKQEKIIPWQRLFKRAWQVNVPESGEYDAYPNRDSLPYQKIYGLRDAHTIIRGTLRPQEFCAAWDHLIQLGFLEKQPEVNQSGNSTWKNLTETFLPGNNKPIQNKIADHLNLPPDDKGFSKLSWLNLFSDTPLPLVNASPADQLAALLNEKWAMQPNDRDMIVMMHRFEYENAEKKYELKTTLVRKGKDKENTAMAETVGLPVAICAKLIAEKKFEKPGMWLPVEKSLYEPVMQELEEHNIKFKSDTRQIQNNESFA